MINIKKAKKIISRITLTCLDKTFKVRCDYDVKYGERLFIQIMYKSKCNKTGKLEKWRGRKWYLSKYMTEDEVVKTIYSAFEACVKHEVMEGFKVDNIILFNPHVNFEELLKVSNREISRT